MPFYPTIRDETVLPLNVVVQNLDKDRGYLDHDDCPYSETVKNFFRRFLSITEGPKVDLFAEAKTDGEYASVLDKQVEKIINDLEAFADTLGNADHSEKLAYFKAKTGLLEKLVGMRERIYNLREMNEFRGRVVGFLDEICTVDQITELMKRLDGVLGTRQED